MDKNQPIDVLFERLEENDWCMVIVSNIGLLQKIKLRESLLNQCVSFLYERKLLDNIQCIDSSNPGELFIQNADQAIINEIIEKMSSMEHDGRSLRFKISNFPIFLKIWATVFPFSVMIVYLLYLLLSKILKF